MNKYISTLLFVIASCANATDNYDANTNLLTMPSVIISGIAFKSVVLKLNNFDLISVGTNQLVGTDDIFDKSTNIISIPSVNTGGANYTNVVIKVNNYDVVSAGVSNIQGPQGLKGDTGATGSIGLQGAQGIKGDPGLQGIQGTPGITGATGSQGSQGATGAAGSNGKTVLNGAGVPSIALGAVGDFYINTSGNQIYGAKTASGWGAAVSLAGPQGATGLQGPQGAMGLTGAAGLQGIQGATGLGATGLQGIQGTPGITGATGSQGSQGATGSAGSNGKTVLNGAGAPATNLGTIGDFYINTSGNQIYGAKTASGWGAAVSLVGPQGATGSQGPQGTAGLTGAAGLQGVPGSPGLTGATGPQGPAGSESVKVVNSTNFTSASLVDNSIVKIEGTINITDDDYNSISQSNLHIFGGNFIGTETQVLALGNGSIVSNSRFENIKLSGNNIIFINCSFSGALKLPFGSKIYGGTFQNVIQGTESLIDVIDNATIDNSTIVRINTIANSTINASIIGGNENQFMGLNSALNNRTYETVLYPASDARLSNNRFSKTTIKVSDIAGRSLIINGNSFDSPKTGITEMLYIQASSNAWRTFSVTNNTFIGGGTPYSILVTGSPSGYQTLQISQNSFFSNSQSAIVHLGNMNTIISNNVTNSAPLGVSDDGSYLRVINNIAF